MAAAAIGAALAACGSGSGGGGDRAGGGPPPPADPSHPPPPDTQPPSTPPPPTTPGTPSPADPPPPGSPTLMARKLGGAGDEWARGIAACGDGTTVAVSSFGPPVVDLVDMYGDVIDDHDQPWLGVTRLGPDGRTRWSRQHAAGGGEWHVDAVACGARGESWLAVWAGDGAALDFGAGPIAGAALVKLAPGGEVAWQHALGRRVSDLAPGPDGTLLVGTADARRSYQDPGDGAVALLGPDGRPRWERIYAGARAPRVAFTARGDVVVAAGGAVEKLARDGALTWRTPCAATDVEDLGVAADGTIVAKGVFIGGIACGLGEWNFGGPGVIPFVVALDADGRPLWQRDGLHGKFVLLPDGSAITLGGGIIPVEVYDLEARRETGCGTRVLRWEPATGAVRWLILTADCPLTPGVSARTVYLSVAPGGDVWIQGDGKGGAFEVGDGPAMPEERDWFVARIAP